MRDMTELETSDFGLSRFLNILFVTLMSLARLPPRRANVTVSPSVTAFPPFPFLFRLVRSRKSDLSLLLLLLPPLPPLPLLSRPFFTIQAFGFPSCSLLVLFTDHPRFIEYLLLERGVLGPGGGFFVRSADDGCANMIRRQYLSLS